ncbi:hypothetical protein L6164_023948 [Bauhinia variegata]|uniref:Uncharacterized protein n=1 Tax=Bauhinia variegata TaxID=167791 RepID=A0ACB9LXK7_BAUVA|nr:hypothetical protein L6164_023948 [Bauhinia variegata]
MDAGKEEFLKEFGEDYGYPNGPKSIDVIRATEFKRLEGLVYLDHAGTTLYSEAQMESVFKDLTSNTSPYCTLLSSISVNFPIYSQSDSSSVTHDIAMEVRQQVLDYCNASPKDYKCIFTSGATAALKLIGEAFPWSCKSNFMYTMENHNSVLGIREYALGQGASAIAVDIEDVHPAVSADAVSMRISPHQIQRREGAQLVEGELNGHVYNLFAFPSECNFSGLRFNLDLVKIMKEDSRGISENSSLFKHGKWMVLIDAAKGCATGPPDLSKYPADFVTISFYKIFGYPTGLGALIVRSDAAKLLKKSYFSGGTVAASIADIDFVKRREGIEELYEDGTLSFLSIASVRHGFKILNALTVSAISRHTASLALYTRKMLSALRHGNGSSVCVLYGSCISKDKISDEIPSYRDAIGLFGYVMAVRTRATKAPTHRWVMYGSKASNLQSFAIKVLSLTCSAFGCERNWSVFENLHTKRRNRLEQARLNNLVYVKYNRTMRQKFIIRDNIDLISLTNIDESNEWLIGKPKVEDDYVFEDDDLTWDVVAQASGVEVPIHPTRQSTSRAIQTPIPTPKVTKRSMVASSFSPNMDEDVHVDNGEDA